MELRCYVVDAFSSTPFGGNPAAIVPLDSWLPDSLMQSIAAEHNLAETAFFIPKGDHYHLRWFTPGVEVDLCGHATVAAGFVIEQFITPGVQQITFDSLSGPLGVSIDQGVYTLDFPSRPPVGAPVDPKLLEGLGGNPIEALASRDYLVTYATQAEVQALKPNMLLLSEIDRFAAIATAPGDEPGVDFVSRFFAPAQGVPEDPVTGSAHSTLIPYWAAKLGKSKMRARQISARGGELFCELHGDRVKIGGRAVLYSKNEIYIPG